MCRSDEEETDDEDEEGGIDWSVVVIALSTAETGDSMPSLLRWSISSTLMELIGHS